MSSPICCMDVSCCHSVPVEDSMPGVIHALTPGLIPFTVIITQWVWPYHPAGGNSLWAIVGVIWPSKIQLHSPPDFVLCWVFWERVPLYLGISAHRRNGVCVCGGGEVWDGGRGALAHMHGQGESYASLLIPLGIFRPALRTFSFLLDGKYP